MKNFLKLLLLTIVSVIIMLVLLVSVSPSFIIKNIINNHSQSILGLKVECSGVKISIFDGSGVISGLTIYNPSGKDYFYDNMIFVKKISFEIKKKELLSRKIHIKELKFLSPKLNYEKYSDYSNLTKAISAIKNHVPANKHKKEHDLGDKKYKVVIDELELDDMSVNIYFDPLAKEVLNLSVHDMKFKNIGNDNKTTTISAFNDVLIELNKKIIYDVIDKISIKDIGVNVSDKVMKSSKEIIDGVGGVFDKIKK